MSILKKMAGTDNGISLAKELEELVNVVADVRNYEEMGIEPRKVAIEWLENELIVPLRQEEKSGNFNEYI